MFGAGIYFAEHSSKVNRDWIFSILRLKHLNYFQSNQYVYGIGGGNGCPQHKDRSCYSCHRSVVADNKYTKEVVDDKIKLMLNLQHNIIFWNKYLSRVVCNLCLLKKSINNSIFNSITVCINCLFLDNFFYAVLLLARVSSNFLPWRWLMLLQVITVLLEDQVLEDFLSQSMSFIEENRWKI